ncbi:solute carrier family 13 member 4 [Rhipicephalus sanguineus]|uniref:solute carrier family 13 member 4 n=1 Tax=Rhipicephalus sanguineus TaxID=34632 RepID=UPI0020C5A694|nr:solute carrier family 13 member 4 [Rhipicephalus sanguineus]
MSQLVMQFVLALCSSLLTELVSNTSAVSVLLPVAVDIAVTTPCNPLYFAIPVTVAASTSLVLPTSGVSLAVLTNLVDIGPVQLLVLGLSLKFVALIMILLTVNLNTDFHRLPQWIFTERRNQTATTIF